MVHMGSVFRQLALPFILVVIDTVDVDNAFVIVALSGHWQTTARSAWCDVGPTLTSVHAVVLQDVALLRTARNAFIVLGGECRLGWRVLQPSGSSSEPTSTSMFTVILLQWLYVCINSLHDALTRWLTCASLLLNFVRDCLLLL